MPEVRGWIGEKVTTGGLWHALDGETYRRIDNLIVPSANGTPSWTTFWSLSMASS